MKVTEITGERRLENWTKTRTGCRGVLISDGKLLLSHETVRDLWMLPGGGKEGNESDSECCVRELAEETGILVKPSEAELELIEYYDEWKWVNRYMFCEAAGTVEKKLTEGEKAAGLEPVWLPLYEALDIFASYMKYADTDETKCFTYLREHTALTELLYNRKENESRQPR